MPSPLRLRLDTDALAANWRWLAERSAPSACGAAVKADGYGLGAVDAVRLLSRVGCCDYFVATWGEALALGAMPEGSSLSVLHGVRAEDRAVALNSRARPVLNSAEQVLRWRETGLPCDVMIDTGINRLGISLADVQDGLLSGLNIYCLMSHLASADEDSAQNEAQLREFAGLKGRTSARKMSLANSAGICLGPDYAFDLTRPGLALYGGIPREEAAGHIAQVAHVEAQVLQRRRIGAGDSVGYNATFTADRDMELAILNIGYADGYLRGFSGGRAGFGGSAGGGRFPVIGRVSMDLVTICVDANPQVGEGDWIEIDYNLPAAAHASGLSQYELLTGLGQRFERVWV